MSDKTKLLSAATILSSLADNDKIVVTTSAGNVGQITKADLKAALLGGLNLSCMLDGVFIMYHSKKNNMPLMVKPQEWPRLQSSGEFADGVAVIENGRILIVAPTEPTVLPWSSAPINCGATAASDRLTAIADLNGKANTASIIAASTSEAITNTAAYAPGFCNLYSRVNASGGGLSAGKWWLPSVGEMMMLFANMTKINYCFSLIAGATPLEESVYWTSTEGGGATAWYVYLSNLALNINATATNNSRVRPVSAFIV